MKNNDSKKRCRVKITFVNIFKSYYIVIVKSSSGPRYVVGVKSKINREKLVIGN